MWQIDGCQHNDNTKACRANTIQIFSPLHYPDQLSTFVSMHTMQACGRTEVELHSFFLEVSVQHHAAAALVPGTKCKGGWVCPRAGLDMHKRNISCPCQEWFSSSVNTITLTLWWLTVPVNGFHFWCPRLSSVKFTINSHEKYSKLTASSRSYANDIWQRLSSITKKENSFVSYKFLPEAIWQILSSGLMEINVLESSANHQFLHTTNKIFHLHTSLQQNHMLYLQN